MRRAFHRTLVVLALAAGVAAGQDGEADPVPERKKTSGRNRGPADPPPAAQPRGKVIALPGGSVTVVDPGFREGEAPQPAPRPPAGSATGPRGGEPAEQRADVSVPAALALVALAAVGLARARRLRRRTTGATASAPRRG